LKQIAHDIKHSWYFRVWGLSWLVFALVVFSALIILSKSSNQAAERKDVVLWVENATSIQFPVFHFRLDHRGNETFDYFQCFSQGVFLNVQPCQSWKGFTPALNTCIAWDSNTITAYNDWTREDHRIECEMVTTGSGYEGNLMMAFEIEGENVYSSGGMMYSSLWVAPNDMAWVLLQKNLLQIGKSSNQVELWERDLVYHSTIQQPNIYNITIIVSSFLVKHFDPTDTYNGWMSIGDIGGVGFFMMILHTIVMIFIGLFFSNTSLFLNGHEATPH